MTTTELIAFLKKHEFGGATGRPREVHICADGKIYDFDIKNFSTGDGLITELYIDLGEAEEERGNMIAIKDMEMPKFCGECLIGQWDDYEPLGTYCPLLTKGVDMNHKDVDCPLIEVKECEEK